MERKTMKATFAGGCFWCMQPPFREHKGVTSVVSGYAGGTPTKSYPPVQPGISRQSRS